jgi:hypothetical protein
MVVQGSFLYDTYSKRKKHERILKYQEKKKKIYIGVELNDALSYK